MKSESNMVTFFVGNFASIRHYILRFFFTLVFLKPNCLRRLIMEYNQDDLIYGKLAIQKGYITERTAY